jgi:shikimate kinase
LAEEWGWRFVDLDETIEASQGCSVSEIFDKLGEPAFRLMETAALRQLIRAIETGRPHVIALGGGTYLQDNNYELVHANGVALWLDCPLDVVERRVAGQDHRPLARDVQKFRALFETRRPAYARADHRIEIHSDDSAQAVRDIQALGLV